MANLFFCYSRFLEEFYDMITCILWECLVRMEWRMYNSTTSFHLVTKAPAWIVSTWHILCRDQLRPPCVEMTPAPHYQVTVTSVQPPESPGVRVMPGGLGQQSNVNFNGSFSGSFDKICFPRKTKTSGEQGHRVHMILMLMDMDRWTPCNRIYIYT